jgi:hypothetical protein
VTKQQYLHEVELELRDLPWKVRRDLVADLDGHLDELSVDHLGPPRAYAEELRASAGLERRRGVVAYLRARRPRNLAIVTVLLLVAALLASALAWVESYQPLATGNYGITVPQPHVGAAGEESVTFHDGKPFELGFSVENRGEFTVRVVDGPTFSGAEPFSARLYVSRSPAQPRVVPGPLMPFRPFALPPGAQRMLFLKGVFSHCVDWTGPSSFGIDSLPVTFSFLWRTDTVRIPLSSRLVIQIPPGRRCLR